MINYETCKKITRRIDYKGRVGFNFTVCQRCKSLKRCSAKEFAEAQDAVDSMFNISVKRHKK